MRRGWPIWIACAGALACNQILGIKPPQDRDGGAGGGAGAGGATSSGGRGGAPGTAGAGGSAGGGAGAGGVTDSGGRGGSTGGGGVGTGGISGGGGATGAGGAAGEMAMSCAGTIVVPTGTLTGAVRVNGAAPPTTQGGTLSLRGANGDQVPLGVTTSTTYRVGVKPGTYEVFYAGSGTNTSIPRNTNLKLGSVTAPVGVFDIDIPSVVVAGSVRVNGSTPPTAEYGRLSLRGPGGDEVFLTNSNSPSYSAPAAPGTYDVYYATVSANMLPRNKSYKLRSVTVAATGTTPLDIDIPSVVVSGNIRLNGATAPTVEFGTLSLRTAGGDEVVLTTSNNATYSTRVAPGAYDVYYANPGSVSAMVPRNSSAKIGAVTVAATGTTPLDIDIPFGVVSGTVRVNGVVPAPNPGGGSVAQLYLRSSSGDNAYLGDLSNAGASFTGNFVPGTYDVFYSSSGSNANVPRNMNLKLQTVTVAPTGTMSLALDIPAVVISGSIRVNGMYPQGANNARLSLRGVSGDTVDFGYLVNNEVTYTGRVVPGTYDVFYDGRSVADAAATATAAPPRNHNLKVLTVTVAPTGMTTADIDIPSTRVSGDVTNVSAGTYALTVRNAAGDEGPLGAGTGSYGGRLGRGTYDIFYAATPTPIAGHTNYKLGCVLVVP